MSKTLLVILIIAGMTVGGTAFAAYGPQEVGLLDLFSQYVEGNESDAIDDNGDENGEEERSETAQAVHKALTAGSDGEGLKPGDEGFGKAVSENARAGGSEFGQSVAAAARNSNGADDQNDEENDEEERSETAQAVHKALTADPDNPDGEGLKPGDEGFGKAVSENAKAGGSDFGQSVAEAARGSNGSANASGRGNAPGNAGGRP